MTSPHRDRRGSEHAEARERLEVALAEEGRLADRYDAALGTASEIGTCAQLREASEQVAARGAWVRWLERDY